VLELADDIELIDLPPEELIERLRQGKVYVQAQIARAIQNFFSKGNLTALRELAMRVAADRVDAQMTAHMRSNAIPGPWPANERCWSASTNRRWRRRWSAPPSGCGAGAYFLDCGQRSDTRNRIPVRERKGRDRETLRLAESLGAEVVTLNTDAHVAREILDFARAATSTASSSAVLAGAGSPPSSCARRLPTN